MITPTRVAMKQSPHQIMETDTSKPWDTYLFSDNCHMQLNQFSAVDYFKMSMRDHFIFI